MVGAGRCRHRCCWSCPLVVGDDDADAAGSTATSRAAPARSRPTISWSTSRARTTRTTSSPTSPVGDDGERPSPSATTAPPRSRASVSLRSTPSSSHGDHRPRHRRRRRLRRHPPARCRPVRRGRPGRGATAPGRVERRRQGVAAIERARLQRELDITPTRVRIILSTDPVSVPAEAAPGTRATSRADGASRRRDEVRSS